jgi:LmbE family N-acetylglucosaminyl deacetylase
MTACVLGRTARRSADVLLRTGEIDPSESWREVSTVADFADIERPAPRPPWQELESIRPLTLRACRRIVVVAPHPRDEIRAAGGLLRRLGSRNAEVDVLSLTDRPTRTCSSLAPVDEEVADALDQLDELPDPDEAAAEAAYRALGLSVVRRHRLGLHDGGVAAAEADVVGAISEIVGFADDPSGLCVLAPWSGDGDDDHEAAGRAAEVVTAAYRVRLVRWLDRAWSWAGPDSDEVPWRRARQIVLTDTLIERKHAASEAFSAALGAAAGAVHDLELPDGSAPGPREVFLV